MKILHVAYIYPPNLNVADGITNVVYNVTKELAKKGHQVTVYTSNLLDFHNKDLLYTNNLIVNGVNVYYLRSLLRYKTFIITPSMIRLLHKNINNFDIIHIHDCRSFQGISVYLLAKRRKIPYIFQPHGSFLYSLPQSPFIKIVELVLDKLISEKIVKNASKIIALSRVEAEQYKVIGVSEDKIAVIPNGIDLSEYANLPPKKSFKNKFNIPEFKKIILYLGRIHETKGIDFLIKAYAHLTKNMNFHDAILVIAGPDHGYLSRAISLVSSCGLSDKVVFTGMLPEKEKIEAYVDSSIVVNVEPRNVFGLVPLEAMACSRPVIVCKSNAISDIIHKGKFGFSVKYGDIKDLMEVMYKMLNNEELLREMGQKGRKFVFENCDWVKVVTKLDNIYQQMAK